MRKTIILGLLVVLSVRTFAQQTSGELMKKRVDSLKAAYLNDYALRYPLVRQASVSVEDLVGGQVKSKLYGNDFYDANLQLTRVNANFNAPIARLKKFSISSSFGLFYQYAKLNDIVNHNTQSQIEDMTLNNNTLSASLNVTRVDSLFNRPVVVSARASVLFDPVTGQNRINGSGLFSMTLKKTANSTLGIGAFVVLDPTSPVPFAPYISYYYKFKNRKLEFILDPPIRVALRKELTPKQFLTLSTNLGGSTVFFLYNNQTVLPQDHIFSTVEIKSGLTYERLLTRKMVLGISGGVSAALNQKSLKRNDIKSNPFAEASQKPVPYLNVGVSFLPFWHH